MSPFDPAQIEGFTEAAIALEKAIDKLRSMGIVATVETVPELPLAMGNYKLRKSYRLSKELYRPIMDKLAAKSIQE